MDILKYFYEEPAALETLTPDLNADARPRATAPAAPSMSLEALLDTPVYYRGYLAGTDLATDRVGATALSDPDVFIQPLLDALGPGSWQVGRAGDLASVAEAEARTTLRDPEGVAMLVWSNAELPVEALQEVAEAERRQGLPALKRLLDAGAVVCFPEPAHHGFDWSVFAARPLREALRAAFERYPSDGARRFLVPFQRARSEHKFYFETWQLDQPSLPTYIEEI